MKPTIKRYFVVLNFETTLEGYRESCDNRTLFTSKSEATAHGKGLLMAFPASSFEVYEANTSFKPARKRKKK